MRTRIDPVTARKDTAVTIDLPTFPTHRERMKTMHDRFREDTATHVMRIRHDDGLYRHLVFGTPGTSIDRYELITVPGLLTMTGDRGDYSFRRLEDMFQFFGTREPGSFDPHYWAQKCVAGETRRYSEDSFTEYVVDRFRDHIESEELTDEQATEIWEDIQDSILRYADFEYAARDAIHGYEGPHGFAIEDSYDSDFRELESHFIWACNAIAEGVRRYRRVTESIV
jgi:hypothetical protein